MVGSLWKNLIKEKQGLFDETAAGKRAAHIMLWTRRAWSRVCNEKPEQQGLACVLMPDIGGRGDRSPTTKQRTLGLTSEWTA